MSFTKQQLAAIAPTLKEPKLSIYTTAINDTMDFYGIDEPSQQCMFIAQVMHESGACFYVRELASGSAYEGRKDLGNTQPGDGVRYKGRGLIQITGRNNYKQLSEVFGVDFIAHPELLEQPEWATKSAGWFWSSRKLNDIALADTDTAFLTVTKRINGGTNGLEDRRNYWTRAKKSLGL